jgi:hypothetical protein
LTRAASVVSAAIVLACATASAAGARLGPLLVDASLRNGEAVVAADPATHSCTRVRLPGPLASPPVFAGRRVAVMTDTPRGIWSGRAGSKLRFVRLPAGAAIPVWIGSRLAYARGRLIRFVGGGSLAPALPAGAHIRELTAQDSKVAIVADWGGETELHAALFVLAGGRTRRVADEPEPFSEEPDPVWSPDGTRIAFLRSGDLWTMAADGSDQVRLSHTPKAVEGGAVWSPDSQQVAYFTTRHGTIETYVAPATGGAELRLTHTKPTGPGVPHTGTQPLAWAGDRVAVKSFNSIAVVSAGGGPLDVICTQPLAAWNGYGAASWTG